MHQSRSAYGLLSVLPFTGAAMNTFLDKLTPSATDMLRMDHTHVLSSFHHYDLNASHARKRALVDTVCLALEIHAKLEEEIFYPAMRALDEKLIDKSLPEHAEMHRLIGTLRSMEPRDPEFDRTFMELMRDVIHHVADEETLLFPEAERLLGARLGEISAEMKKRRLQLAAPRTGRMIANTVRAMPPRTVMMTAGALLAGTFMLRHSRRRVA
jgi:hemerythrin superfamily protein